MELDEACDDGNTFDNDGCSADCTTEEAGWNCSGGDFLTITSCSAICNDNLLLGSETCRDDDISSGDGCSPVC